MSECVVENLGKGATATGSPPYSYDDSCRLANVGGTDRIQDGLGIGGNLRRGSNETFAGKIVGTGLAIATSFANPCGIGALGLTGKSALALRGLAAGQALGNGLNARDNFNKGNYLAAAFDGLAVFGNLFQAFMPCFAAGTPVLTPDGPRPIEALRPGDWVLSAPEEGPHGPVAPRRVEEAFRGRARLLELRVGGRSISTTAEHPFYVQGRGWTPAGELMEGDRLRSHDGRWTPLAGVADPGVEAAVYNLQVAEYHTYFVGGQGWGFSAWTHNTCNVPRIGPRWGARSPSDPACASGCEIIAGKIQKIIGGEIKKITPKVGDWLGDLKGLPTRFGSHDVVVKGGKVFDIFTGHKGLPIGDYKALWKHGADGISFNF